MEERASIDCARVVRGTNSTAKAESFLAMIGSRALGSSRGLRNPMITQLPLSLAISSGSGRFTQARTSASGSRSERPIALAPAVSYSASGNPACTPAPVSIPISTPVATSFLTDSGVNATLASPGCVSRGTAILIGPYPLYAQRLVMITELLGETLFLKARICESATLPDKQKMNRDQHHRKRLGEFPNIPG